MGKKNKFEKLGKNENFYLANSEEIPEEKPRRSLFKRGKDKVKNVVEKDVFKNAASDVPEKQKISKRFTFKRNKVKEDIYLETPKAADSPCPKAPFVLLLSAMAILVLSGLFLESSAAFRLSENAANLVVAATYVVSYLVPIVIYVVSSPGRMQLYNIRKPFSGSFALAASGLGLVVFLSALQKYFIAYTFSYTAQSEVFRGTSLGVSLMLGAVLPAVCEELFFRGVLQYEISRYGGAGTGILLSAAAFSIAHFDLQYFTIYLTAGLVMGLVTHVSGSCIPAIAVHLLNNVMSIYFSERLTFVAIERIGGSFLMIVLGILCFMCLIIMLQVIEKGCNVKAAKFLKASDSETLNGIVNERAVKEGAALFYSKDGKTASKLVRAFTNPLMLSCLALFIVTVVIKAL